MRWAFAVQRLLSASGQGCYTSKMKRYLISSILFTGVLFSTAQLAVGIKCYECNTVADPKCGSDTVRQLNLSQCPSNATRCFSYRQEGIFYSYTNEKYEPGLRILRGCSTVTEVDSGTCIARSGQAQSMRVRYCSCNKDDCNSVLLDLKASAPLIFALQLFLFISGRY
uniref:U-PAR/Ly-6 domain n=1 Tax=Schistocephalus solidus TaxID=70667 RepID=A0A0X3PMB2_SCHSO